MLIVASNLLHIEKHAGVSIKTFPDSAIIAAPVTTPYQIYIPHTHPEK
jgi:hypothetical protein